MLNNKNKEYSISLTTFEKAEYVKELAAIEKKKALEKYRCFYEYNLIFKQNFNVLFGIDDIYEKYTGAVRFKDYEWELIDNNKIKKIFLEKYKDSYIYMYERNHDVILRGCAFYYYFSCFLEANEIPSPSHINLWYQNYVGFLLKCQGALESYKIIAPEDVRLLLAVLDNIRNFILIMTNIELFNEFDFRTDFLIHLEEKFSGNLNEWKEYINKYQSLIHDFCFVRPVKANSINEIKALIKKVLSNSNQVIKGIINKKDSSLIRKCFFPFPRESDHYINNYIVLKDSFHKLIFEKFKTDKQFNWIGIMSGALELPFILYNLTPEEKESNIFLMHQYNRIYFSKLDEKIEHPQLLTCLSEQLKLEGRNILVDENVMTGASIQCTLDSLKRIRWKVDCAVILKHPDINRIEHMCYCKRCINIKIFDDFFIGMLCGTEYTKIKENTNYGGFLYDEFGVYSLNTETYFRGMYRNNSFIRKSEVDIFKGYSIGMGG